MGYGSAACATQHGRGCNHHRRASSKQDHEDDDVQGDGQWQRTARAPSVAYRALVEHGGREHIRIGRASWQRVAWQSRKTKAFFWAAESLSQASFPARCVFGDLFASGELQDTLTKRAGGWGRPPLHRLVFELPAIVHPIGPRRTNDFDCVHRALLGFRHRFRTRAEAEHAIPGGPQVPVG
jgi:hypothetical protein